MVSIVDVVRFQDVIGSRIEYVVVLVGGTDEVIAEDEVTALLSLMVVSCASASLMAKKRPTTSMQRGEEAIALEVAVCLWSLAWAQL